MKNYKFNVNNFDLIRLFAAFQVALHHGATHLGVSSGTFVGVVVELLNAFPGVPIFFFISGFLISRSYENNPSLSQFTKNRFLRLYPGLFVCGVLTMLSIMLSGFLEYESISFSSLVTWVFAQLSFFQFYDPDFLAGYGIGQTNGSLWTIYIEIQFYILIPIIYYILKSLCNSDASINKFLIASVFLFYIVQQAYVAGSGSDQVLFKLLKMTFLPYFYMFLLGVVFQRFFVFFEGILSGRFVYLLAGYGALYYVLSEFADVSLGNLLNPVLFFVLCCLVFSFAFSFRELSGKLLKRNDVSYGLYIYHMPVINFFMWLGLGGSELYLILAISITAMISVGSWLYVEKPCMKLKTISLNSLAKS